MCSINVLTVDAEPEDERALLRFVEDAGRYFPVGSWDEIRYLGKLAIEHNVEIATNGGRFGAFLFEKLMKRIRDLKDSSGFKSLLLGITPDPIVASYHFFDGARFKRSVYLVHDYVDEKVGVVSIFKVNTESSSKVIAHGLGHNRGLLHHTEPIDLMYPELLKCPAIQVDGFCDICLRKLMGNQTGI